MKGIVKESYKLNKVLNFVSRIPLSITYLTAGAISSLFTGGRVPINSLTTGALIASDALSYASEKMKGRKKVFVKTFANYFGLGTLLVSSAVGARSIINDAINNYPRGYNLPHLEEFIPYYGSWIHMGGMAADGDTKPLHFMFPAMLMSSLLTGFGFRGTQFDHGFRSESLYFNDDFIAVLKGTSNVAGLVSENLLYSLPFLGAARYFEKNGNNRRTYLLMLLASCINVFNGSRLSYDYENYKISIAKAANIEDMDTLFQGVDHNLLNADMASLSVLSSGFYSGAYTLSKATKDLEELKKLDYDPDYYDANKNYWYIKGIKVIPKKEVFLSVSRDDLKTLDELILDEFPALDDFKLHLNYDGKLTWRVKRKIKNRLKDFMNFWRHTPDIEGELSKELKYFVNE